MVLKNSVNTNALFSHFFSIVNFISWMAKEQHVSLIFKGGRLTHEEVNKMPKVILKFVRADLITEFQISYSRGPALTNKPAASLDRTKVCQLSKLCRKH